MERLDATLPGYGFAQHKGYGTSAHVQAIRELGPSAMHRRTFRGVTPMADQHG
jgi:ribonuclease HII